MKLNRLDAEQTLALLGSVPEVKGLKGKKFAGIEIKQCEKGEYRFTGNPTSPWLKWNNVIPTGYIFPVAIFEERPLSRGVAHGRSTEAEDFLIDPSHEGDIAVVIELYGWAESEVTGCNLISN